MHRFSVRLAGHIMLGAFASVVLLHLLVLRDIVPWQMLWGGLADTTDIAGLSLFAIGVALFVMFVTANNLAYIPPLFPRLMRILMWIICGYLLVNTAGNLLSANIVEQYYFAPITCVLSVCAARVAWGTKE